LGWWLISRQFRNTGFAVKMLFTVWFTTYFGPYMPSSDDLEEFHTNIAVYVIRLL
jgi:hypothetical protein